MFKQPQDTAIELLPNKDLPATPGIHTGDLPKRLKPSRTLSSRVSRLTEETWHWECFLIFLSLGSIGAVVAVLYIFDGKPVPDLPDFITINTIISILGTISAAALMSVVAASISQLKWVWFRNRRSLDNLEYFNNASQGPAGAVSFLVNTGVFSIGAVGAIITILNLPFSPFLQQAVFYPTEIVFQPDAAATVKQSHGFLVGTVDMGFVEGVNRAIWSQAPQFDQVPACASGNCTWPTFKSVGWCHICEDAKARVRLSGCDMRVEREAFLEAQNETIVRECNVTFADSDSLPSRTPIILESSMLDMNDTEEDLSYSVETAWEYIWDTRDFGNQTILGMENPIASLAYVKFPGMDAEISEWGIMDPEIATECVLDFCVREYRVSVVDGEAEIDELSRTYGSSFDRTVGEFNAHRCWHASDVSRDDLQFEEIELPSPYNLTTSERFGYIDRGHLAFCALDPNDLSGQNQEHLYWFWGGKITPELTGQTSATFGCTEIDEPCGVTALTNSEFGGSDATDVSRLITTVGIEHVMESLAASLTKLGIDSDNAPLITGMVGNPKTFIRVRWLWLILPIVLSLSGVVLLLLTIVQTKRQHMPLWKGSLLPLLYHGLDDAPRSGTGLGQDTWRGVPVRVTEMAALAKITHVQFRKSGNSNGRILLG